jgi:hypothetical protein
MHILIMSVSAICCNHRRRTRRLNSHWKLLIYIYYRTPPLSPSYRILWEESCRLAEFEAVASTIAYQREDGCEIH